MPEQRTDDPKILERLESGEFISAREVLEDQHKKLEILISRVDHGVTVEQLLSIVRDLIIMAGVTNATLLKLIVTLEEPPERSELVDIETTQVQPIICCPICRVVAKLQSLFLDPDDSHAFRCPKCGGYFSRQAGEAVHYADLTDEEKSWMGKDFHDGTVNYGRPG